MHKPQFEHLSEGLYVSDILDKQLFCPAYLELESLLDKYKSSLGASKGSYIVLKEFADTLQTF